MVFYNESNLVDNMASYGEDCFFLWDGIDILRRMMTCISILSSLLWHVKGKSHCNAGVHPDCFHFMADEVALMSKGVGWFSASQMFVSFFFSLIR